MPVDLEDVPLAKRVRMRLEDLPEVKPRQLDVDDMTLADRKRLHKRKDPPEVIDLTGPEELVVVDNPRTQDLDVIGVIGHPPQPRTLNQVRDVAAPLMEKYLPGWSFGFDDATKRAGVCYPGRRHISLAKGYALSARVPDSQILDTILHEISHGLAPPGAHHGPVWKKIALDIGCTGERCHSFSFMTARYKLDCPCGATNSYKTRVNAGATYRCRKCKQVVKITNTGVTKQSVRH